MVMGGYSNCWVGGSSLPAPTYMWYLKRARFVPVSGDDADGDSEGRFVPVSDDDEDGDGDNNDGFDNEER